MRRFHAVIHICLLFMSKNNGRNGIWIARDAPEVTGHSTGHLSPAGQVTFPHYLFIFCLNSEKKTQQESVLCIPTRIVFMTGAAGLFPHWNENEIMKLKSNNMTEPCQNVISHRIECWNWAAAQGPGKIIKKERRNTERGNCSDRINHHKKKNVWGQ